MSPNSAIDDAPASATPEGFALCVRLAFCLVAAPAGWALHLLVNTSIAGKNCAGAAASEAASQTWSQAISAIYIIDFIAVCLAIAAGYLAYELWSKATNETGNAMHRSVHSGEGRMRFLALWAMLSSILFAFAIVAGAVGVFVGPIC